MMLYYIECRDMFMCYAAFYRMTCPDSLSGSSVTLGTIHIICTWPLSKDDAHKWRSVYRMTHLFRLSICAPQVCDEQQQILQTHCAETKQS